MRLIAADEYTLNKYFINNTVIMKCSHCGYEFQYDERWRCFKFCYNCGKRFV